MSKLFAKSQVVKELDTCIDGLASVAINVSNGGSLLPFDIRNLADSLIALVNRYEYFEKMDTLILHTYYHADRSNLKCHTLGIEDCSAYWWSPFKKVYYPCGKISEEDAQELARDFLLRENLPSVSLDEIPSDSLSRDQNDYRLWLINLIQSF